MELRRFSDTRAMGFIEGVLMRVDAFLALRENDPDHKYEYINGKLYMMTGGKPEHSYIGGTLIALFRQSLQGKPCLAFNSDACVKLAEDNYVCPDVVITCDPRDRQTMLETDESFLHFPRVLVEVLSPGTRNRDMNEKKKLYMTCPTLQEYLIVDSEAAIVQIYRRESDEKWSVTLLGIDDLVELTSIGVQFSVEEIYENTRFDKHA